MIGWLPRRTIKPQVGGLWSFLRRMGNNTSIKSVTFDYVQEVSQKRPHNVHIIDVRTKDEIMNSGEIPGSHNIPSTQAYYYQDL